MSPGGSGSIGRIPPDTGNRRPVGVNCAQQTRSVFRRVDGWPRMRTRSPAQTSCAGFDPAQARVGLRPRSEFHRLWCGAMLEGRLPEAVGACCAGTVLRSGFLGSGAGQCWKAGSPMLWAPAVQALSRKAGFTGFGAGQCWRPAPEAVGACCAGIVPQSGFHRLWCGAMLEAGSPDAVGACCAGIVP